MNNNPSEEAFLNRSITLWDNSVRSKTVIGVFIFYILYVTGFFFQNNSYLETLKAMKEGIRPTEAEAAAIESQALFFTIGFLICYIVTVVVFLNWFRRAYGNLHRVGLQKMEHEESMAAWAWFIPVIFLFRPVQIMSEIWSKTQNVIKEYDLEYVQRNGSFLIGAWWTLFIGSQIIGQVSFRLSLKEDTIDEIIRGFEISMWADLVSIPEAMLLIIMVYLTSRLESKMAERVVDHGGQVLKR